uniref:Protein kinase domain-containing protein n=1 Tax=Angiostrongylus cantonensis TaxID=6313 RepID=A0A0K0DHE6_ANGCA
MHSTSLMLSLTVLLFLTATFILSVGHDLRVRREHITLKELIGGGQFGNVYRGTLADPGSVPIPVAVKVCKIENEPMDTQLILQESHLMKNLQHENIISLIGVCMDAPMWLIMELAPLGELRQYLQSNRASLTINSLILYSLQIARALAYLHGKSFVHRDIAARNVLVSTPRCAKLTDFGLSRALDYDAVYTGILVILVFIYDSMVYSVLYHIFIIHINSAWLPTYGCVCVWEIMSWGVKPWHGVANADVITRIETGERLPCPDGCPPVLFNYLELMLWALQPQKRPTAKEIVGVCAIGSQLKLITFNVPVLLTNIATLPNLTLWRTLEEQKRQAEENDRWLDDRVIDLSAITIHDCCVNGLGLFQERLRNITPISLTVTAVIDAIDRLSNAFNTNMKHDDFVSSIKAG